MDEVKGTCIDMDAPSKGDWFSYFGSRINEKGETVYEDPLPGAGRVCIRSIGPIVQEIQGKKKRRAEFVLNPQTRSMERVSYYDDVSAEQAKKESEDVWDYCITGMENFLDKNGKPIECNRENKSKLMDIPAFSRFVARCLQLSASAGAQASEEAEKN